MSVLDSVPNGLEIWGDEDYVLFENLSCRDVVSYNGGLYFVDVQVSPMNKMRTVVVYQCDYYGRPFGFPCFSGALFMDPKSFIGIPRPSVSRFRDFLNRYVFAELSI